VVEEGGVAKQSFHCIQSSLVKDRFTTCSTFTVIITSVIKIKQFLVELNWWRILQELLNGL